MTTHRAAPAPRRTFADLLAAIKEWADAWAAELDKAREIDLRPILAAWRAFAAWAAGLADAWTARRNDELAALAERTRLGLQAWSADADYQRAIRAWAIRRTGVPA